MDHNNNTNSSEFDGLNVIEKKSLLKSLNLSGWVFSLIYIVIGCILIKYPESAIRTVCYIIGSVTLLFGLIKIIIYFRRKNQGLVPIFDLSGGIVSTALGIFLLVSPETVVSIIPIIVGIIILFHAILKIRHALDLSKAGYKKWWVMLLIALLTAVLGALILFNPFDTVATLISAIGIIFVIDGILSFVSYIFTDVTVYKLERN